MQIQTKREIRKLANGRWLVREWLYPTVEYMNLGSALMYLWARQIAQRERAEARENDSAA